MIFIKFSNDGGPASNRSEAGWDKPSKTGPCMCHGEITHAGWKPGQKHFTTYRFLGHRVEFRRPALQSTGTQASGAQSMSFLRLFLSAPFANSLLLGFLPPLRLLSSHLVQANSTKISSRYQRSLSAPATQSFVGSAFPHTGRPLVFGLSVFRIAFIARHRPVPHSALLKSNIYS